MYLLLVEPCNFCGTTFSDIVRNNEGTRLERIRAILAQASSLQLSCVQNYPSPISLIRRYPFRSYRIVLKARGARIEAIVVSSSRSIIYARAGVDSPTNKTPCISGRQSYFRDFETLQPIKTQYNRWATIQTRRQSKCNCVVPIPLNGNSFSKGVPPASPRLLVTLFAYLPLLLSARNLLRGSACATFETSNFFSRRLATTPSSNLRRRHTLASFEARAFGNGAQFDKYFARMINESC